MKKLGWLYQIYNLFVFRNILKTFFILLITHLLIEVIKSLKDEELIKIELSQLFQDMAIFYSQKNNIEKAKESIQKAILLNPNAENIEIQKLINTK